MKIVGYILAGILIFFGVLFLWGSATSASPGTQIFIRFSIRRNWSGNYLILLPENQKLKAIRTSH